MSQTFFTNVMRNIKALTPPPICQEKVIGASGAELVPLGCFQVKISFPLLLDLPKVALTCCVYQNLLSDILMGSGYLKYVNPLTVSQFTTGYVFNSVEYSQPSLTPQQAHQCNQELTRHVFTANRRAGKRYTNRGLKKITEMWEKEGHSAHRAPPPERVWGVSMDKHGGREPSLHEKSGKRKLSEHDSFCVLLWTIQVFAHALWAQECRSSILQVSASRGGQDQ